MTKVAVSAALLAGTLLGLVGVGVVAGSAPAGAASGSPVVIGDLCSCTGPEASTISQTTNVMEAWASWVNSHGGLGGHPVQLMVKDDGYSPTNAVVDAQDFVSAHVAAIFDNSDEDPSWGPIAEKAGIPVLGGQETDSGWQNPDFYPPGGTFNYTNANGAIMEKKAGIKNLAVLYCAEVAICKESTDDGKPVAAKYGIKYVYESAIGFAAPNYTAECLAAKEAGAKAMTVGDASAVVEKVVENCATQGYTPIQTSSDGTVAIAWLGIKAFDGNLDTQSDLPWFVHDSATQTMYAALDKYAPGVPKGPNFGEVVLQSWADGALLQEAVKTAKATSSTAITSALIKQGLYGLPAGDTLGGLAPSALHYVKGQPANNSCFYEMGIQNSKFVWLNSHKPICAPLVKPGTMPS